MSTLGDARMPSLKDKHLAEDAEKQAEIERLKLEEMEEEVKKVEVKKKKTKK